MSVDEKESITIHWMNVLTWMIKIIQHYTQNTTAILRRYSHIHYLSNSKCLSLDLDLKSEMGIRISNVQNRTHAHLLKKISTFLPEVQTFRLVSSFH